MYGVMISVLLLIFDGLKCMVIQVAYVHTY